MFDFENRFVFALDGKGLPEARTDLPELQERLVRGREKEEGTAVCEERWSGLQDPTRGNFM